MNSHVIHEISLEGTRGLWAVGFMEKKGFEARMSQCHYSTKVTTVQQSVSLEYKSHCHYSTRVIVNSKMKMQLN